jgi:putative flippase GtrA
MTPFLRYLVVGSGALGVHLVILEVLLLAGTHPPWIASAIGFVVACVFNYLLQRLWVFRSSRSHAITLPVYIAVTTIMLGVNTVLFVLLLRLSLPPLVAQTATTACVFILNFFSNRCITFGQRAPERL